MVHLLLRMLFASNARTGFGFETRGSFGASAPAAERNRIRSRPLFS
jgi:hypothetical protein